MKFNLFVLTLLINSIGVTRGQVNPIERVIAAFTQPNPAHQSGGTMGLLGSN